MTYTLYRLSPVREANRLMAKNPLPLSWPPFFGGCLYSSKSPHREFRGPALHQTPQHPRTTVREGDFPYTIAHILEKSMVDKLTKTDKRVDEVYAAERNFHQTLSLWGKLPTSKTTTVGGLLCISTGVPIADQNYVWGHLPSGEVTSALPRVLDFFGSAGVPFTWWVALSAADEGLERSLAAHGLPVRCSPRVMVLRLPGATSHHCVIPPEVEVTVVRSEAEALQWSKASLEGFESPPRHGPSFTAFATGHLHSDFVPFFRLMTLSVGGVAAVTALLSLPGDTAGLYYFSTRPGFRRQGLGKILLGKALAEASRAGCSKIALQASPMGHLLYLTVGFRECGRFTVHSPDPDAC